VLVQTHLPGYIQMADDFKSNGVDEIICTAVNDPFVMAAWGKAQKADGKITMLADTQMELTKAWDIVLDAEEKLGNKRMKRFSAVLKDGKIADLNVEADGAGLACSLAEVALEQVKKGI
jgi:2-Cys peroxiredoxin 5